MKTNPQIQIFQPTTALQSIVHHYQWLRFTGETPVDDFDFLPNYGQTMIFYFWKDQPLVAHSKIVKGEKLPKNIVVSSSTLPAKMTNVGCFDIVMVFFHSGGLSQLFPKYSLYEGRNQMEEASEIIDKEINYLRAQLEEQLLPPQKIAVLDAWIYQRLKYQNELKFIYPAFAKVIEQPSRIPVTVQDVADSLGLSRQHLNRLTRQQLGFTAKEALNIYRFNQVMSHIHQANTVSLSQTAHAFGYTDQAHFSHQFKRYSGRTPAQYLRHLNKMEIFGKEDYMGHLGMLVK
ncbi:MAG: helix-turn-helix domain-containing protein [Bacteroidota bacterium]